MTVATIDNIPVQLGDIVSGPEVGKFTNGRVKGWSPCGRWLYVGWLGVLPIAQATWCESLDDSWFARVYCPVKENRWSEAIAWGFAPQAAPIS